MHSVIIIKHVYLVEFWISCFLIIQQGFKRGLLSRVSEDKLQAHIWWRADRGYSRTTLKIPYLLSPTWQKNNPLSDGNPKRKITKRISGPLSQFISKQAICSVGKKNARLLQTNLPVKPCTGSCKKWTWQVLLNRSQMKWQLVLNEIMQTFLHAKDIISYVLLPNAYLYFLTE